MRFRHRSLGCSADDSGYHQKKSRITSLSELSPGDKGVVLSVNCKGKLRKRLMDMGLVKGVGFEVERVAPLGDPMGLKIKGFHLSLRREEAGEIIVEVLENE